MSAELQTIHSIYLFGRNGSGTTTHAKNLRGIYGNTAAVVSPGDLCREAIASPSNRYHSLLTQSQDGIMGGRLVPDSIIGTMISREMNTFIAQGKSTFFVCGYPRTAAQIYIADQINDGLRDFGYDAVSRYVYLHVSEEEVRRRTENRRREFIEASMVPRHDDEPEVVERRLRVFRDEVEPAIMLLSLTGEIFCAMTEGKDIDIVDNEILSGLRVASGSFSNGQNENLSFVRRTRENTTRAA